MLNVARISSKEACKIVIDRHYLHRRPPVSFAFGLIDRFENILGVITFGVPASRHMLIGACPDHPEKVLELNRLWVDDLCPRNTESWFLSRCLKMMPDRIILSYADTSHGHLGYVYRASNFNYSGWTDMDRKTPRFDYVSPGKHSRDAFRNGYSSKVRRKPKMKYWTVTGNKREKKKLVSLCRWLKLDWKSTYPTLELVT